MPIIAIALVIAAALGGGTAFAAQQSLPGDALWGFKTAVNEHIGSTLALDDESKAGWDISAAATRLYEAQRLAADGTLDGAAQAAIQANLEMHVRDVATLVAKLKAEGKSDAAARIAARLQATLAEHAAAVGASASASARANIEPFLAGVRDALDTAASVSASTEAGV